MPVYWEAVRLIISLAQMKILSRLQTTNPQQIKNREDALSQELLREMYLASLLILRPCIYITSQKQYFWEGQVLHTV